MFYLHLIDQKTNLLRLVQLQLNTCYF
jgi:hypothetical protein